MKRLLLLVCILCSIVMLGEPRLDGSVKVASGQESSFYFGDEVKYNPDYYLDNLVISGSGFCFFGETLRYQVLHNERGTIQALPLKIVKWILPTGLEQYLQVDERNDLMGIVRFKTIKNANGATTNIGAVVENVLTGQKREIYSENVATIIERNPSSNLDNLVIKGSSNLSIYEESFQVLLKDGRTINTLRLQVVNWIIPAGMYQYLDMTDRNDGLGSMKLKLGRSDANGDIFTITAVVEDILTRERREVSSNDITLARYDPDFNLNNLKMKGTGTCNEGETLRFQIWHNTIGPIETLPLKIVEWTVHPWLNQYMQMIERDDNIGMVYFKAIKDTNGASTPIKVVVEDLATGKRRELVSEAINILSNNKSSWTRSTLPLTFSVKIYSLYSTKILYQEDNIEYFDIYNTDLQAGIYIIANTDSEGNVTTEKVYKKEQ